MSDKYLTSKDLVARWGDHLSTKTLANWRYTRKGPNFRRLGGKPLYPLSIIEEYEQRNTIECG